MEVVRPHSAVDFDFILFFVHKCYTLLYEILHMSHKALVSSAQFQGEFNVITGFHEERAILLGHLGRHEQALAIYIHLLNDGSLAEE